MNVADFLAARTAELKATALRVQKEIIDERRRGAYLEGRGPDPGETGFHHGSDSWDQPALLVGPATALGLALSLEAVLDAHAQLFDIARKAEAARDSYAAYVGITIALQHLAGTFAQHPDYNPGWGTP